MATRVTNLTQGEYTLPAIYGSVLLGPSQSAIIADTPANVATALGNPTDDVVDLALVPDGQPGAITPAASVAAATAYTPTTSANWTSVPANMGAALDNIAAAGGAGGHAIGGDLAGNLPNPTIASGAVTAAKLGALAVGTAAIAAGAVTAPKLGALAVGTAAIAALAVTAAKAAVFVSSEQTGTGSSQSIAHGLGVVPSIVFAAPTDTSPSTTGAYTIVEGTHTTINVVVTVTAGKKFKVLAWA